jgi:molybdate transport system substrate-binding protein
MGAAIILTHAAVAGAAEIRVLCSTGMSSVMSVLVPEFERASGHKFSIAYDTANLLMGRIKGGETADLAILTGPAAAPISPAPASASPCVLARPSPTSARSRS